MAHPLSFYPDGDEMALSYETRISLRTLSVTRDRTRYIIEDTETSEFYEMPEVCVAAIERIRLGEPLDRMEVALKREFPDEDVHLLDFINQLIELDLVSELDGQIIPRSAERGSHKGYEWIPAGIGQLFFNSLTAKLYIGLLGASIALMLYSPELFPVYEDVFIDDFMMKNMAFWMLVSFVLVLLHELGHVLAVRSENLPAKIGLGHRMFFVVLETDMTRVWSLPVQKRNKLFLAGIYVDFTLLFLALAAQFLMAESGILTALLKLVVLDTFIRLLYQAGVFMKTDLYYVLENTTGCYNLMENGRNFLAKWLPPLKVADTETFKGEEGIVRTYAIFYLFGTLVSIFIAIYYYLPQFLYAMQQIVLPGFTASVTTFRFWDSAAFLLQIIIVFGLLVYSWSKKYRWIKKFGHTQ